MPSIDASINLTDNMSRVLNKISKSVDGVIGRYEGLDDVTETVGTGIVKARKKQDEFTESVKKTTDSSSKLLSTVKNLAITIGGMYGIATIAQISTDMTNLTARLSNANDGLQTTQELTDMVFASANRSASSFNDTADAVAKLVTQTDGLFKSTKEALAFSELLNKSFAIGGTSAEGKSSVMLQLTQAMSSGVLRGEEFNALNENAGQLVQIIADYMGVAKGEMKDLASEGAITADIIKNAIFEAGADIDETFNEMPNTLEDVKTKISNIALQMFQPFWKQIEKFTNSDQMQKTISGLAKLFGVLASVAVTVFGILSGIFNFVIDNWSFMAPVILTVASAMMLYAMRAKLAIAYTTILGVVQGVQLIASKGVGASFVTNTIALAIYNAYTKIATLGLWGYITATWSAVTAQYALLAPLLIIVGIFLAVVGVIYLVVWAYNMLTGSTISAMGIIVGVVSVAFAFIYNGIGLLWNHTLAFAEFLINVFIDPVYSIKKLFANLAKSMINVMVATVSPIDSVVTAIVKACVSGIDWVLGQINTVVNGFGSVLSAMGINIPTIQLGLSYNGSSVASDLKGLSATLDTWVGDAPEGYVSLDKYRLDSKDLGDAFEWGYNAGQGIEDSITGVFDLDKAKDDLLGSIGEDYDYTQFIDGIDDAIGGTGAGDGYGSGDDPLKNIDGTTGRILGELATTNDELKYLVDVAKKNQSNSLTNVSITVPVTMTNNMNGGSDLTGAIDYMTEQLTMKVSEALETSSYGVHY